MKNLKTISALLLTIFFTASMSAQDLNKEVASETKINKFKVKSELGTIDYTVKVNTKSIDYSQTVDNNKQDQPRVADANNTVTTIMVNNDFDRDYDNVITLRYKSKSDQPVEVVPTGKGFDILVNGERLHYDFVQQVCDAREGCPVDVKLSSTNM